MSIRRPALVLLFTAFFATRVSAASSANTNFSCVITCDREIYQIGQQPIFQVRITNMSSKEAVLVGSLDGSTTNRRFPKCQFDVIDSAGKPVQTPLGMCGNMNVLRAEDFVTVASGKSFNPFGPGFFSPYQFSFFPVQQRGTFKVRFAYSTKSKELSDYFGDERMNGLQTVLPSIRKEFDQLSNVELQSNELTLLFIPKSK